MRKTRFTQMVVLVCIGSLAGCTSGEGGTVGNTELNVIVPVGSDLSGPGTTPIDLQRVEYTINCEGTPSTFLDDNTPLPDDGAVQINGNLEVVDGRTSFASGKACNGGDENGRTCAAGQAGQDFCAPGGGTCDKVADFGPNLRNQSEIWQGFMDLPQGPCTVQLRARDGDGEVICTATENFQILPDVTTKVNVLMICDISFQAPVGSLDLDGSFSFVVGNFCPDLFVLNCNAQDEPVNVVDTPFGPQAPSLCEVRFRDVDSTCGQSCDPQTCDETPEGLDCTPAASPGVSTTVTCEASPPGSAALDCDLNGVPDASCTFSGDTLGSVGGQPSGPLAPADGGFAIGFALCTQGIVDGTDPGCGIAYPCPIPVACDADNKVGNPLFSGATMTCTAVTTDGDDDCQKTKTVTVTGPGDSPCVQEGCFPGEDCAFCSDGITCTADTCDDSSGAAVCPNAPLPAGSDCSVDFGGASAECDGAGVCELLGCNSDADCPAPDGNCLGQSTCLADLTCGAQPPVNDTGACNNSGVGSGAGTCNAGTCDTADGCGILGAPLCADADECNLGFCDTGLTPYACGIDPNAADGNSCNSGAGVCSAGACVLPPVCDAGSGTSAAQLDCLVTGSVNIPLIVDVTLDLTSDGAGNVDFAYEVLATNGSFAIGGVAGGAVILDVNANTAVTDASPATVEAINVANIGTFELTEFLINDTVPSQILLAQDPGVVPNACGNPVVVGGGSTCDPGNVPPAFELKSEAVVPDAVGTDCSFAWSDTTLTISAAGGALIISVNTSDPAICDPALTVPMPPITLPAVAQ